MLMRLEEGLGRTLLSIEVEIKGWSGAGAFPVAH